MRIRQQLVLSAILAGLVTFAVAIALVQATRQAQRGLDEQASSQEVARHISNLLALTNEFTVFGSERVALQWRSRAAQLAAAIEEAARFADPPDAGVVELRRNVRDLAPLFDKLVEIGNRPATEFGQRRRELLLERLLTQTQEVIESRHRWAARIAESQQRNHRLYTAIVLAAPAALLLLLLGVGVRVGRRVLGPARRLQAAALAIAGGDLDARCASAARDELGDAARAVDTMAQALQRQSAALQSSEQRLRLITDSVPALICHIDDHERFTFVNAHLARALGRDRATIIGRTVHELRGEAGYAEVAPHIAQALGGEEVRFESTATRDARTLHRQSTFVPDRAADGAVRGVYALILDITEQKEAELRLAASERLLVNITDHLPALIAYIDRDLRYRFANSKYRDWMGVDPSQMIGRTIREAMGEAFHANVAPACAEALAGQRGRQERHTVRDGRESFYMAESIPDVDADGTVRGFYGLTVDITAMKQAQRRQAQVERQLRAITDNLPVLITYIDADERFRFVNATARDWYGLDPERLIGRRVRRMLRPDEHAVQIEHLRRALDGERIEFTEESRALDRTRNLQSVYVPDVQDDGRVAGIYTLSFDVSALKEVERRLVQLARFDGLTGLPNRRQFEERLEEAVGRSARDQRPIAVMFLDIDHFKRINDSCGHAIGDLVLKEFALRLKHTVRATDMPARLAGDEFVVLLEGLRAEADATIVAEKLVAVVRQPFRVAGTELRVTTSVGIAYAERPESNSDLLGFADQALYRAKDAGRDTFALSTIDAPVCKSGPLAQDEPVLTAP